MVHESVHVQAMKGLEDLKQDERENLADTLDSIYLNDLSYNSALLATGNVLSVIDEVCTEEAQCGEQSRYFYLTKFSFGLIFYSQNIINYLGVG